MITTTLDHKWNESSTIVVQSPLFFAEFFKGDPDRFLPPSIFGSVVKNQGSDVTKFRDRGCLCQDPDPSWMISSRRRRDLHSAPFFRMPPISTSRRERSKKDENPSRPSTHCCYESPLRCLFWWSFGKMLWCTVLNCDHGWTSLSRWHEVFCLKDCQCLEHWCFIWNFFLFGVIFFRLRASCFLFRS